MQVAHTAQGKRSFLAITVVLAMTVAAARGVTTVAPADAPVMAVLELALRLMLIIVGALAVRAMWQRQSNARMLAGVWAALVLGFLLTQEIAVGFFRNGMTERLLAASLIALVMVAVVWRVQSPPILNDGADG